ncbi:MAG: hypothetical protein HLX47_12875 [Staphylococcus sp.]|nr:hypothetical protein [Staphylococcus sp.]NWN86763.1 hypothetical protein [Staphylococcus sp.]
MENQSKSRSIIEANLEKMHQIKNDLKSLGINIDLIQPNSNLFHQLES